MFTAYALIKNFESRSPELKFKDATLQKIGQGQHELLNNARRIFPYSRITYGDWIYKKIYQEPPPVREGETDVGLGRIPVDIEDTLLLFRLFRVGDICISGQTIEDADGRPYTQYPYWATSEIHSILSYKLEQAECPEFDEFSSELPAYESWESVWFKTARRFFLSGGAKEFNVNWDNVERIVDYMIALEATLSMDMDYLRRRISERGTLLLNLPDESADEVRRLLKKYYDFRSTIAHGSQISEKGKNYLRVNRVNFESVVRRVLVEAVRRLPSGDAQRKEVLHNLFDISDEDRCEKLVTDFSRIESKRAKWKLMGRLMRLCLFNR